MYECKYEQHGYEFILLNIYMLLYANEHPIRFTFYRGFPESRPIFSPDMGAYFRWAFIWC